MNVIHEHCEKASFKDYLVNFGNQTLTLTSTYEPLSIGESNNDESAFPQTDMVLRNFSIMSILFSANHGCVVACLALATARLGSVGAWQSGILFLAYTLSALLGSTYVVKRLGARNSLVLGMTLYVAYVGCFVIAIHHQDSPTLIVYSGAAVGGIGAGILWTAQGVYFSQAVEESGGDAASLAGIFAFWYLGEEVALRLLSTFLLHFQLANWQGIFGLYTIITIVSAIAMLVGVDDFSVSPTSHTSQTSHASKYVTRTDTSPWHKATAAIRLLVEDSKMRHMIGLNAAYGFASAFMNSYINGEVVVVALQDDKWLGLLTSYCSAVAAGMSLIFGKWKDQGSILVGGAICFGIVGFLFFLVPLAEDWGWIGLLFVYFLMGVGRSTFEGTLKATFADYFAYEKEGAFANIIVQNGFCGSIGYILTFNLPCQVPSRYCVLFRDGSHQYILIFELIVILSSIAGVLGYYKASKLHQAEKVQMVEILNPSVEHELDSSHD